MTVILPMQVFGANLGTLRYWESDSDSICRWGVRSSSIPVVTYYQKLNNNTAFAFSTGMQEAAYRWSPVFDNDFYMSTTATSSRIKYYGGTQTEVNKMDIFFPQINDRETGKTYYYTLQEEGTWKYGSSTTITGYKTDRVYGAIIDRGRTNDQYKNTCLHEFGHALGWMGHSPDSKDVMYSIGSSITNLTSADKRHIRQIYYK